MLYLVTIIWIHHLLVLSAEMPLLVEIPMSTYVHIFTAGVMLTGLAKAMSQHVLTQAVLLLCCLPAQVFWRGFFLTALTKVLPAPACVALSALNFAALHLSPHNFLPLLVLGATCDCLYLRSGGNLLTPLLLHGLWNTSQVLQVALLHKENFV